MEKLKLHSKNITTDNIDKIAELFPNCITESEVGENGATELRRSIDFDLLKQELSTTIVEGQKERYQLNWPGKRAALLNANAPIAKTLRPCREESVDFDTTENLFIEGDNLDALKLLQETYLGKVKMIYIDPPYNTGNDFIYNDDFADSTEEYLLESEQKDNEGNRLISNLDSNGRFHSDWLSMMYSRLKLARNLLNDNGLIFISIDDNEGHNLKRLCDEIFGEENFIDPIIWKKRYGGGAKEKYLVALHEYILVYGKSKSALENLYIPLSDEQIKRYYLNKDEYEKIKGPYRTHPLEAMKSFDVRDNLNFSIPAPDGTMVWPKRQWRWGKERVQLALSQNEIEFKKNNLGEWILSSKQYLKDENGNIRKTKPFSIIDDVYTQHGTNEIVDILGNAKFFGFPKPSLLLKKLVTIGLNYSKDDIILDFFAGSATTAHAVIQLNAEDAGNRKFVMVQLPEKCIEKSDAYKAGYKTIAEISKERIRRAGKKIKEDNAEKEGIENLDTGFRVLKIDSSNMQDVYYKPDEITQASLFETQDNIKGDRTEEDLLFQVLLDWGVDLSLKIVREEIEGESVYFVDENALAACFITNGKITNEICKKIAERKPLRVVFRDSGFANDDVKTNVSQIFKQLSPNTDIKVL